MAEKKTKKTDKEAKPKSTGKEAPAKREKEIKITPRLGEIYKKEIVPALVKTFNYKSVMQVPKLNKIVVNMGVGAAVADQKIMDEAVKELEAITGQKVSVRKSRKAISNFKLRENMNIGAMVTLRRERMYEFLDRLINVALPRVRDFRGLSDKSFDGRGNYTLGVKEQIIFPEINVDKITRVMGMDITIVTTAHTDNEAFELLKTFGLPFRKKEVK
ncbi:MAG: 50S ribosomal protein L5 [Ignavibacteriales bacterium UTCHB2]|jgi:large subunit ribosomal protein L5|nr:MAG: 50S ribosomal protein L5 [Ignavibacteria bacterium ADurb.Bin266]OQY69823.1 MAG: 50S ribosomal protein L5 [Ignavibacteriales bacterium UTCHB2]HQI40409.1 50S ribosomal protein L5 [Ignavibacteriaceae bacterium]HQJ45906.1 50S ribosomal protein L5 [Ignavibacteriaceae bacterium]